MLLFSQYFVVNNCININQNVKTLYGNPDPFTGHSPLILNADDDTILSNERDKRAIYEPPAPGNVSTKNPKTQIFTKVC